MIFFSPGIAHVGSRLRMDFAFILEYMNMN